MSHSVLVLFAFVLVCLIPNATANLESCKPLLVNELTHCFDYLVTESHSHDFLGTKSHRPEHPSSSCCAVLKDTWKVEPECVNFNVLDDFIRVYFWDSDRDTTRLNHLTSTCGIGSLKSNPRKFMFLTYK